MAYHIGRFYNVSYTQAASTNPAANQDNIWILPAQPDVPPPPIDPKHPIEINTAGEDQQTDFAHALLWANFIFTGGDEFYCFWDNGANSIFVVSSKNPDIPVQTYNGDAGKLQLKIDSLGNISFSPM